MYRARLARYRNVEGNGLPSPVSCAARHAAEPQVIVDRVERKLDKRGKPYPYICPSGPKCVQIRANRTRQRFHRYKQTPKQVPNVFVMRSEVPESRVGRND